MCQKVRASKLIFYRVAANLLMRKYLIILFNKIINIKYFIHLFDLKVKSKFSGVKKIKEIFPLDLETLEKSDLSTEELIIYSPVCFDEKI